MRGNVKAKEVKIVEGQHEVVVELKPCGHCGAQPDEAAARQAVDHEISMRKPCAVCGDRATIVMKASLYHSKGEGREGWILCSSPGYPTMSDEGKDWVQSYSMSAGGMLIAHFHTACIKRVAPGVVIEPR